MEADIGEAAWQEEALAQAMQLRPMALLRALLRASEPHLLSALALHFWWWFKAQYSA